MQTKFIIDSASDVLPAKAQTLGVDHLPLKVSFGTHIGPGAYGVAFFED